MNPVTSGTVVLLHGMGRTRLSMRRASRKLNGMGWRTRLVGYPSLTRPIEDLASHVAGSLAGEIGPLHFVTHSLGGLVLRRLLRDRRPPAVGRMVMLAPPNRGSDLARRLELFGRVVPAIRVLARTEAELDTFFGPLEGEVLVVAGSRAIGPLRWVTESPNDGIVRVEETGANPFVVHAGHTFIMNAPEVLAVVDRFLRTGETGLRA
jgi:alpha-beta hydrolase superfamily lysophospholipase